MGTELAFILTFNGPEFWQFSSDIRKSSANSIVLNKILIVLNYALIMSSKNKFRVKDSDNQHKLQSSNSEKRYFKAAEGSPFEQQLRGLPADNRVIAQMKLMRIQDRSYED